jgi:hypothetical protein
MPSLTMTGALTTWRFAPLVSTALAEEEERDERRVGPDDQQHEDSLPSRSRRMIPVASGNHR